MDSQFNTGFIKVHRKLLQSSFYNRSQYVHLWLHLLLKANHAGKKIIWNNKEIELQPGQLITGRIKLETETGINQNTIQYILKFFENSNMIQQRNNSQNRIITIVSWHEFQKFNNEITTSQQRANNEITTSQQRDNTNNNVKNEKNEKNEKNINSESEKNFLDYSFVSEKVKKEFTAYIDQKTKKPKNQKQAEQIYQHLQTLSENNSRRAAEILKQSIRNQWQDLYPLNESITPKHKTNGKQSNNLTNLRQAANTIIQSTTNTENS
jgi:predicted transcriptional regulator